jgi:cation diffusion facilitator family transporter
MNQLTTARPECLVCGQRIAWVGIAVNLVMVALKVLVGIAAGSKACLADALHSSSNIVTAFAILISRKLRDRPADDGHPYGYGKIEFIAAGAVSLIIITLTGVLVFAALDHIIYKPVPPPHLTAMLIAVMSIATNELMFRYFKCVGTQLRSQTILANAWANRADCFSSLAVVVGVVGARLGFHHLDPIAAVVVAAIIIKVSINCIRDSIAGLMDRSVPPATLDDLMKAARSAEGVERVEQLRARLLGNKIWVEIGIGVDPDLTVDECEAIREALERRVRERVNGIGRVSVSFESDGGDDQ